MTSSSTVNMPPLQQDDDNPTTSVATFGAGASFTSNTNTKTEITTTNTKTNTTNTKTTTENTNTTTPSSCSYYCGATSETLDSIYDVYDSLPSLSKTSSSTTAPPSSSSSSPSPPDDDTDPTPPSNLLLPHRHIHIITTATLPWRTGTAVNPLLRALYLMRYPNVQSVTLVVPWLENQDDRESLYKGFSFDSSKEQEEWLREYAVRSCGFGIGEVERLGVLWYPAVYRVGFGSIFPTVDICGLIPEEVADVAVLEEPEHLNWIKVHPPAPPSIDESKTEKTTDTLSTTEESPSPSSDTDNNNNTTDDVNWMTKFNHVVGIIHTNYGHYAKQAGFAVAAPAIGIVSTLVIRAYCHKVIKLSATLPTYAPGKEIVCNVHGVREEFIRKRNIPPPSTTPDDDTAMPTTTKNQQEQQPAAVYFIGKLVWAKGFDIMLKVQDLYRKQTGAFFPIDIYGSGPEEKVIKRAFHGRKGLGKNKNAQLEDDDANQASQHSSSSDDQKTRDINVIAENNDEHNNPQSSSLTSTVLFHPLSVRDQSFEMLLKDQALVPFSGSSSSTADGDSLVASSGHGNINNDSYTIDNTKENPLSILCDFKDHSLDTGIATSKAVYHIADKTIQAGLGLTFTFADDSNNDTTANRKLQFDPPKSRFELRRHPIPALFKGVLDHAILPPSNKIFLNPSLSEVLCTTTAEALAMNKFVILPRHVSNDFFFQFPNALGYSTVVECVAAIQDAMRREPEVMSEELRRLLTWEAATERFVTACVVTKGEERERVERGVVETDKRIAWLHSRTMSFGGRDRRVVTKAGGGGVGEDDDVSTTVVM